MAKHVSRLQSLITSNPVQLFCRNRIARLKWEPVRGQHSKPSPELPIPKQRVSGEKKGFFCWRNVGFFALGGAGYVGYQMYVNNAADRANLEERQLKLGKAAIGGKWELIDVKGNTRKSEDFLGKWCLIYFGFTHCPDVCPDELEKMAGIVEDLEKKKVPIQSIFVTVDPERDTKELVDEYVKEFSPKILGLAGSKQQIRAAAKAFRVYYSSGPKDKNNDYIIDHTIIQYLINPNGEFVDHYGQNKSRKEVTASILDYKKKWDAIHKTGGWFSY